MLRKLLKHLVFRLKGETDVSPLVERGLRIGSDCSIQAGVSIDPDHCWHITIGSGVTLAARVQLLAHDASPLRHLGSTRIARVTVGDRVFIGAGSIVLPGTRIGEESIIGAGSVVRGVIPPRVVAAGNPAVVVSSLDEFLEKHRKGMERGPCFEEELTVERGITAEQKVEMDRRLGDGDGYVIWG